MAATLMNMLQISHQAAAQYKAFVIKVMLNVVGMLIGQYSDQFKIDDMPEEPVLPTFPDRFDVKLPGRNQYQTRYPAA